MELRLVEVVLPSDIVGRVPELLAEERTLGVWDESLDESHRLSRILVRARDVEAVVDRVEGEFRIQPDLRIIVFRVEATVPAPADDDDSPSGADEKVPQRVSRQELYAKISKSASCSSTFLIMVGLSTIVAGIGLLRDSGAVIIGAMVIAPLLGPNVSLALATTLGDTGLAKKSLWTNACGVTLAFLMAWLMGFVFHPSTDLPEIASRTEVGLSDPVLALAAGCAGVLAFTTGAPASLIGVMVAVALLPPLTVAGLMMAGGHYPEAIGAGLLVLVNVICVNLAGVVTFLGQGIRPRDWWEADRAKRASRLAIVVWMILLGVLIAIMVWLSGSSFATGKTGA